VEQVVRNSRFTFIFRQETKSANMHHELKGQGEAFLKKNQGGWAAFITRSQVV